MTKFTLNWTVIESLEGTTQKQPAEIFYRKGVPKSFTKFTEKTHVSESLF